MKFLITSLVFTAFGCSQSEVVPSSSPPRNVSSPEKLIECPHIGRQMTERKCFQEIVQLVDKTREYSECPKCPVCVEPTKPDQPDAGTLGAQPLEPSPQDNRLADCLQKPQPVPEWKKEFNAGKGAEQDPIDGLRTRYHETNDKYRNCADVLKEYAENGPNLHERFPLSKAESLDADKAMKAIVLENGKALLALASMKGDFPSDFAGEDTAYYRHDVVDELTELFEIDGLTPEEIGTTGKKLAELRQKGIREVLMNWMKSETDGTKDVNLFGELCDQIEKKTAGGLTLDEIKELNCELLGD